ncbi:MAG: hypothetical protein JOY62_01200 [Acidobacteriaceae bacterium]|nr:hypothetical protein [Acidobacteriaceae bacterium]MBV9778562.1 hypothetical protein [Acidobacteriaceae bacterium]
MADGAEPGRPVKRAGKTSHLPDAEQPGVEAGVGEEVESGDEVKEETGEGAGDVEAPAAEPVHPVTPPKAKKSQPVVANPKAASTPAPSHAKPRSLADILRFDDKSKRRR